MINERSIVWVIQHGDHDEKCTSPLSGQNVKIKKATREPKWTEFFAMCRIVRTASISFAKFPEFHSKRFLFHSIPCSEFS